MASPSLQRILFWKKYRESQIDFLGLNHLKGYKVDLQNQK